MENNLVFLAIPVVIGRDIIIGTAAVGTTTVLVYKVADSIDTRPSYVPEEKSTGKQFEMSRPEEERITSTAGPQLKEEPRIALPGGHKDEVISELVNYGDPDFAKSDPYSAPQHRPEPRVPVLDNPIYQPTIDDVSFYANSSGEGKRPDDSIWTEKKGAQPVENAYEHWGKHSGEFPELNNSKDYVNKAHDFVRTPPSSALIKERPNGDILIYDEASNIFAVKRADGTPRTMFKPSQGIEYWKRKN